MPENEQPESDNELGNLSNPEKQSIDSSIYNWDARRGEAGSHFQEFMRGQNQQGGIGNELGDEEIYAEQLATEQDRYQTEQQLVDFHNDGIKYGHPSYA